MSARGSMTHRCTIERKAKTSDGAGGHTEAWSSHLTGLACRAWFDEGKTLIESEKITTITQRVVIVPLGTDVTKGDRIASVTDRKGATLFPGPMPVSSVQHRQDHIQLFVREIT